MDLRIDTKDMHSLVSEAILTRLSEEQRNILIQEAIGSLLTPVETRGYGTGRTQLQEAFRQAVYGVSCDVVKKTLEESPAVIEAIQKLVAEAVAKLLANNDAVNQIASVLSSAHAAGTRY